MFTDVADLFVAVLVPFLLLSAVSCVITFRVQQSGGAVLDVSNLPIAGRIANRLDFMGASYLVDGACASSTLAIDHAMKELLLDRCDLALAGGDHLAAARLLEQQGQRGADQFGPVEPGRARGMAVPGQKAQDGKGELAFARSAFANKRNQLPFFNCQIYFVK